ncbi:hypothetical protein PMI11_00376 [Rhizobium sp. CF142]|nr:hypothetical protein PMI11_00376 [Rhizobium sp. CF142]
MNVKQFPSRERLRKSELSRIAAPKQELCLLVGCLTMFWLISAASLIGYITLTLFLSVAIGRIVQNVARVFAERLPRRSQLRRYIVMGTSVVLFSLMTVRGCYLATVIVDFVFRSDPFEMRSSLPN